MARKPKARGRDVVPLHRVPVPNIDMFDFPKVVERKLLRWLDRLEAITDLTEDERLEAENVRFLIGLGGGRAKVDVNHTITADPAIADALKHLSVEQLNRIAAGDLLAIPETTGETVDVVPVPGD